MPVGGAHLTASLQRQQELQHHAVPTRARRPGSASGITGSGSTREVSLDSRVEDLDSCPAELSQCGMVVRRVGDDASDVGQWQHREG